MNADFWVWSLIVIISSSVLASVALNNSELRKEGPLQNDPEAKLVNPDKSWG